MNDTPRKPHDLQLVERYGAENVIKALRPIVLGERLALLDRVVGARRCDLTVLADRFYDPHNNAAILRSAEAFGLREMHAVPGEKGAQLAQSVTQGVDKWIDFTVHASSESAYDAIVAQGYTLIGADMAGGPPEELPKDMRVCLVMGAEKPGLSDLARTRCKGFVSVAMVGMVESFNVSVAAALLVSALCKRREPELLGATQRAELLARYLVQTVQRPAVILAELL